MRLKYVFVFFTVALIMKIDNFFPDLQIPVPHFHINKVRPLKRLQETSVVYVPLLKNCKL